jgi:hypothetical protein
MSTASLFSDPTASMSGDPEVPKFGHAPCPRRILRISRRPFRVAVAIGSDGLDSREALQVLIAFAFHAFSAKLHASCFHVEQDRMPVI